MASALPCYSLPTVTTSLVAGTAVLSLLGLTALSIALSLDEDIDTPPQEAQERSLAWGCLGAPLLLPLFLLGITGWPELKGASANVTFLLAICAPVLMLAIFILAQLE